MLELGLWLLVDDDFSDDDFVDGCLFGALDDGLVDGEWLLAR